MKNGRPMDDGLGGGQSTNVIAIKNSQTTSKLSQHTGKTAKTNLTLIFWPDSHLENQEKNKGSH